MAEEDADDAGASARRQLLVGLRTRLLVGFGKLFARPRSVPNPLVAFFRRLSAPSLCRMSRQMRRSETLSAASASRP